MATIHVFTTAETKYDAEPGLRTVLDTGLSEKGLDQCLVFSSHSEFLPLMQHVTHVVSSPLCSSIYSCRIAFDRVVSSKAIIVRPELMEVGNPAPSFGSDKKKLHLTFTEQVNLDALPDGWEDVDPSSAYAHDLQKVQARTTAARQWLMELARTAGEKAHIVVMTHGQTAHLVTDDFQGIESPYIATDWDGDLSWRSYKFDFAAEKMVETQSSRVRRGVSADNTLTEDENNHIRGVIEGRIDRFSRLVQTCQTSYYGHIKSIDF